MTRAEEKAIVLAVLDGNSGAFAALIEKYQKPIYNLMYRSCETVEDAADLTQETFIKAYEKLDSFDVEKKFFSWLYTIGINHARDYARKKRVQPTLVEHDETYMDFLPGVDSHSEFVGRQLDQMEIEKSLKALPLDQREALVLRYREDMSMQDIADILDISLSAAKMRVHRALGAMRELMVKNR